MYIYTYIYMYRVNLQSVRAPPHSAVVFFISLQGLAFTSYWFPARLLCTNHHPFIPPAHLHCPPWCNTCARLLGSIRLPPSELSFV